MEFSVFRQVLIRALGHMQSIVEKRATLPILMNVKIEAADDLILSATNVDLELVVWCNQTALLKICKITLVFRQYLPPLF